MFECWDMNTWRMFETLMAASEGLPPISFLTNLVSLGEKEKWIMDQR